MTALHLLDEPGRRELEALVSAQALLAFDYDGTLAPIVADPAQAFMRDATRAALIRVARRFPTAVISGRSRADVARFLAGVPVCCVVGNHGLEWDAGVSAPPIELGLIAAVRDRLHSALPETEGFVIEDKRLTLAIHYRNHPDHEAARARIADLLAKDDVRLMGGKCVLNVLPSTVGSKGLALRQIAEHLACQRALFVGDDVTDEDAFGLEHVLGVRVGIEAATRAPFYLCEQHEIDAVLELLAASRAGPT